MTECFDATTLECYLAGELDEEVASAVEAHIDECSRCRDDLARVSQLPCYFEPALAALRVQSERQDGMPSDADRDWLNRMAQRIADGVNGGLLRIDSSLFSTPLPPFTIPGCEIRGILGRGGMGAVYLAWQKHMQRFVAVKVLPPAIAGDPQIRVRFAREVAALAKLKHPAIVTAYEAGTVDGTCYLLMEYVHGETLSSLAHRVKTVPFAEACEIIRQAAVGIQYAHDQGLIHRDLKPSNLMLNDRGEVRILDLGLARFIVGGDDHELTMTGQLMGTLDYMAPEQIDNSRKVSSHADVYSLGATLYRLLTGNKPLALHASPLQKLAAMALGDVPKLDAREHRLPPALVTVVQSAMQRDCEDRFATAAELAEALTPFCKDVDLAALVVCQEPLAELTASSDALDARHDVPSRSTDPARSETYRQPHNDNDSSNDEPRATRDARAKQPPSWRTAGLIGMALAAFLSAAILLQLSDGGYLKIESLDPELTVEVLRNDRSVDEFSVGQRHDYTWYRSGEYEVRIVGNADDTLQVEQGTFRLQRHGRQVVRIRRVAAGQTDRTDGRSAEPPTAAPKPTWSFQTAPQFGPGGLVYQPFPRAGISSWQIYTKDLRSAVPEMVWSPDGRYVAASVYSENTVRVYDASTWELTFILPLLDTTSDIDCGEMAWSPDGRFLAAMNKNMMMLWDLSARRVRLSTIPLVNRVYHLRWHPSTNVIAAATAYRVVLADPESGKVAEVSAPEAVKRIEWAMAGSLLMVSAESPRETEIFRFTAPPDSPLQTTREMTLPSNVVAFDSAAPRYAWLDDQDQIHVVDWEGGEVDLLSSPVSRVNEIFFGPGDRLAWLAGETHVVHTRLGSGTLIQAKLDEVANVVDWLSEDRIMVSGNRFFGPPVWIVDARGHVTNVPDAHNSPIFSSDQKKLVFVWPHTRSTWQGSLQEMHGDDPRLVRRMIGQGRSPAAATWQPDGTHYAVGHGATVYFTEPRESVDNPEANGLIELYRSSGEFVRTIARPAVVPASLLWSVDGQSFMAGCRDGTMRTWSRSGVAQQVRSAHETTVTDLDRHPNGEVLVSASSRGSVKLWHDDGTVEELFAADLEHEMKVDATFRPRLGDHLLVCREHGWLLSYPPTDERRAIVPCERGTWLFDGSGLVTLSSEAANYLTMPHLDLRGTPIDDREFSAIAASSTSEEVLVGGMFSLRRCNSHISAASPLYRQAYGKASIRSIDYSPDDQRIAVISTYLPDQGPVFPVCWLWSADNQPDEVPLEGHRLFGNVSSVRFNHRGDTILAAGDPGIVMWDLASRSLQRVIVPLPDGQSVTLASDGRILQRTPNALQHLYGVVEHEDGTLETMPATTMDW